MTDDVTQEADRRLQAALDETGARDPREYYRERLKDLKQSSPDGYREAVAYYRDTLLPSVAAAEVEPLVAWTEYGRRLAVASAPGRTVSIDPTGRSEPFEGHLADRLVLHLPEDTGQRALLVGLPTELSPAQRATYDVLVAGRQKIRD